MQGVLLMTRGGRRNLLESQSTDKIIKGIKKKKKLGKIFFSHMTEQSYDLSWTHPLALYGAFTFFFLSNFTLLSYSDMEGKDVEGKTPTLHSANLQDKLNFFFCLCFLLLGLCLFYLFIFNKVTNGDSTNGFADGRICMWKRNTKPPDGISSAVFLSRGGWVQGCGGGGGGGGGCYWMSEWIFTDVALVVLSLIWACKALRFLCGKPCPPSLHPSVLRWQPLNRCQDIAGMPAQTPHKWGKKKVPQIKMLFVCQLKTIFPLPAI